MKVKRSKILEIDQEVAGLYQKDPELTNTKFGYAYKRYYQKNFTPMRDAYNEAVETIHINNALEDPTTKAIIADEKSPTGYAHSKEGKIKDMKDMKELNKTFYEEEVEVEPYISVFIPKGVKDEQKELFKGIII